MSDSDTIAAPATPRGRSAVAMIRISGPRTRDILDRIFKAKNDSPVEKPWRTRTGRLVDAGDGSTLDQAMAVFMPAPATYTGEDLAEITCHGAAPVVDAALHLCIRHGARLAEPGEFTRRAFTNGRIDLAEAEAVCDFISAETQASLDTARRQMSGELSQRIEAIRAGILDAAAEIEARIDFPEEDVPATDRDRLTKALGKGIQEIDLLLRHGQRGRRLRDGAKVAIVGRVNVGKSSIFNLIAGMERAISTPHPGTTRDTIEIRLDIHGAPVDLIDTAGIRDPGDEIEGIGIDRSKREIERADAVIWIIDRSSALNEEDKQVYSLVHDKPCIPVMNKSDLPEVVTDESILSLFSKAGLPCPADDSPWRDPVNTSAVTRQGVDDLERRISEVLLGDPNGAGGEGALVSNIRHLDALRSAKAALADATALLESAESLDFVMVDLKTALDSIGAILGIDVGEEILDRIFQKFCLGK